MFGGLNPIHLKTSATNRNQGEILSRSESGTKRWIKKGFDKWERGG